MEEKGFVEVETLMLPNEEGVDVEYVICDEFELEGKKYMVLSPLEDETIGDDEYLYRYEEDGDELLITSIEDEEEFDKAAAYWESLAEE